MDALRRRCRVASALLLLLLSGITLAFWQAFVQLQDYRLRQPSKQECAQAIDRLEFYLERQIAGLRHVSYFFAANDRVSQEEFQRYCMSLMGDMPGMLAVLVTDARGHPRWKASAQNLPLDDTYMMTSNPELRLALDRASETLQPAMTAAMSVPHFGRVFLVALPIPSSGREDGFVVGILQERELFDYLFQPDYLSNFRVLITHAGEPIYQIMAIPGDPRPGLAVTKPIVVGGQKWDVSVWPVRGFTEASADFASAGILILGLALSFLIGYWAYRWQWRTALLQSEARDSRTRLERTGMSLAEAKAQLDLIIDNVDDGVIVYDNRLDPIQANAAFLTAFNMVDSEQVMLSGEMHHEHMIRSVGSESKYRSLFKALRQNPTQTYTDELVIPQNPVHRGPGEGGGENPISNPQSPRRVFLRRAASLAGPDGQWSGVLVIYKDVTATKDIDRVKDEFLSSVSHELRSPLASIKGFAETIKRDPKMRPETREEFISIIYDETTRLQDLIEELLDLRRMEDQGVPLQFKPYDLKVLAEDAVRGARSILTSKNISVFMQWGGLDEARMEGDVAQISRALRNLLANAVKYSPEGGEIHIRGHCGIHRAWVEVNDQGVGIVDRDLPHIFDRFYRGSGKGRQKGTGLGLAIVKHITEMHGGHLGVRSDVGAGTSFRLELPRERVPKITPRHDTTLGKTPPPPPEDNATKTGLSP